MTDGVVISNELTELGNELGEVNTELSRLHDEFDDVEDEYNDAFNDMLFTLIDSYENGDKKGRLPGEKAREAIVINQMRDKEPLLFGQYRRLRKQIDKKEREASSLNRRIFAKQSQLKWLGTEAGAIR